MKGGAIEAVRIYAEFRRIVLHCSGAWSKKGKMRCVGNKVIFGSVRKSVGQCGSVVRQHAIATELRSPKLNWRFHILQTLRSWEYIERIRQDKGFDPRVVIKSQGIGGYLSTSDLFANRGFRVHARNIGVQEIRVAAGQYQTRVAATRKAKKTYLIRVDTRCVGCGAQHVIYETFYVGRSLDELRHLARATRIRECIAWMIDCCYDKARVGKRLGEVMVAKERSAMAM